MDHFEKARIYQTHCISAEAERSDMFRNDINCCLNRFFRQDWGNICEEDREENISAIEHKDMVLAAYPTCLGEIWITAESRSGEDFDTVTVLFPGEY